MSRNSTPISTELVIPYIDTDIFDGQTAQFAVGMLAVGNNVLSGRERELEGYGRLRANVYADQTGMIAKDKVGPDGTEWDEDDARSVHYGIFENSERGIRVVGAMRLIVKSEVATCPLPIEDFFSDVFENNPAPIGSMEVSRYITRHENI